MIEPRAKVVGTGNLTVFYVSTPIGTELTTVADVLAALRQPSEAMIDAGDKKYEGTLIVEEAFLAMLGQFERDQGSAT